MIALAEVMSTPIAANTVIVVGSATTWPIACSRWDLPNRVKSGMLSESVAQKPTIAVTLGANTFQNAPADANFVFDSKIGPSPWPLAYAACTAHATRIAVMTSTNGAARFSTRRSRSIPRTTIRMLIAQKIAKLTHSVGRYPPIALVPSSVGQLGDSDRKNVWSACPPIHALMPNQPHATSARMTAGTVAPKVP